MRDSGSPSIASIDKHEIPGLGTVVEAQLLPGDPVDYARNLRPTLLLGRTERFYRQPLGVVRFVERALLLEAGSGWGDAQRQALWGTVQVFFAGADERAWIVTLPYFEEADHVAKRIGGQVTHFPSAGHVDRLGRQPTRIFFPGLRFPLEIDGFSFVYGDGKHRVPTEFFGIHRCRSIFVGDHLAPYRDDYIVCLGQPGEDYPLMLSKGDIATTRHFYDPHDGLWRFLHVWFCKVPVYNRGAIEPLFGDVARLGIKIRPGDGRILNLQFNRQSLFLHVEVQWVEAAMLSAAGFHDE